MDYLMISSFDAYPFKQNGCAKVQKRSKRKAIIEFNVWSKVESIQFFKGLLTLVFVQKAHSTPFLLLQISSNEITTRICVVMEVLIQSICGS